MPFVKLDCGILNSTLWFERTAREIFITALLMAEPLETTEATPQISIRTLEHTGWTVPVGWYGFVPAASVGILHRAGIKDEEGGLDALASLGEPELGSRSKDFDGRRLVRIDGGFLILNYMKYRERDYTAADRSRRYRDRLKSQRSGVTLHRDITQAEAEAEVEEETTLVSNNKLARSDRSTKPRLVSRASQAQQTPIIGRNTHLNHAECDPSQSYCVPAPVHNKLADLLAPRHGGDRDAAKTALREWYPTVWRVIVPGFIMGDAFKFWQGRFDDTFATPEAPKSRSNGRESTEAMADGVREILRKEGVNLG